MWKVNYVHTLTSSPYRVSRPFDNEADAREFIHVNAMVHPLPGWRLIDPTGTVIDQSASGGTNRYNV